MKIHTLATLVSILCVISIVNAQNMITDRPDFTESAIVVPSRMMQIECGVEYADFKILEEFSYPNVLARLGIGHNLELRFGFPGWKNVTINDTSKSYLSDLIIEAKYQITNDDATLPMAILLVSTLPTGEDAVSAGMIEIGIKFASAYNLNNRLGLGMNLGAISVVAGEKREILSLVSLSMGIGINNRTSAFVEAFAEIPQNEVWQPAMDGGFIFLLTPTAQLDLYFGKGLNDYAAEITIGAGLSFRFGY